MTDDTEALRAELAEARAKLARHPATADESKLVRGWKIIADRLHVDERTAQRAAAPESYPRRLVVWFDHLGVVTTEDEIERYRWARLRSYDDHRALASVRSAPRRVASKRKGA